MKNKKLLNITLIGLTCGLFCSSLFLGSNKKSPQVKADSTENVDIVDYLNSYEYESNNNYFNHYFVEYDNTDSVSYYEVINTYSYSLSFEADYIYTDFTCDGVVFLEFQTHCRKITSIYNPTPISEFVVVDTDFTFPLKDILHSSVNDSFLFNMSLALIWDGYYINVSNDWWEMDFIYNYSYSMFSPSNNDYNFVGNGDGSFYEEGDFSSFGDACGVISLTGGPDMSNLLICYYLDGYSDFDELVLSFPPVYYRINGAYDFLVDSYNLQINQLELQNAYLNEQIVSLNNQLDTLNASQGFFNLIGSAFNSLSGFLNIQIAPYITLGMLFAIPLAVGIILFVIKLISG